MHLNALHISQDVLRATLAGDDVIDFGDYDHEDYDNDFFIGQVTDVVSGLLNSGNAALAGERVTSNGHAVMPTESIAMIFNADSDGTVGGYSFTYDLWGARRLSIPTRYIEWRHITGDKAGIDGAVDLAYMILALCNSAIEDFNSFIAGA